MPTTGPTASTAATVASTRPASMPAIKSPGATAHGADAASPADDLARSAPALGLSAARADVQAQLAQLAGRRRNQYPMVSDLAHASIHDAAELARATWKPMGLYPGNPKKVLAVIEAIEEWAADRDIHYLLDIEADRMLRDLAKVKRLDGKHSHKELNKLHLVRNTLTALRGTVLFVRESTGRRRSDRPANDRLDAGLPELPSRFFQRSRPLTDDEVLLGNILVEIDLLENADPLPIAAYLVAEAGIRTMESCDLTTEHLDDRHTPHTIRAKGVWGWPPRTIELEEHSANALARFLVGMPDGPQRLTYTGRAPGTKEGSASLNPVIERFLRRAGVADTDVKAKSLALTRPYRVLRQTENFKAAKKIHGGKTHNMLRDFKSTINEDTLYEGKVHVLDPRGKTIAKVKATHLYDSKTGRHAS